MVFSGRHSLPVLFIVVMAVVLTGGCSTPAMKSTPLWDAEYSSSEGSAEDRVNIWPIYYRRDPAVSVLWPLISSTPDGHAVVPAYEWTSEGRVLRLGTVHQYVPAIAAFKGDDGGWRILVAGGNRKAGWWVFPPLVYSGKNGTWTPVITWMKDFKGLAGPLFYRYSHDKGNTWAFPFPFAMFQRGGSFTNWWVFPLAISRRSDTERDLHLLWPLGHFARNEERSVNRLLPFWWQEKDESSDAFVSIPWGSIRKGGDRIQWLIPPLWTSVESDSHGWQTFLFPLAHRVRTPDGSGTGVFPLFYSHNASDGKTSAFTSLPVAWKSGSRLLCIGGPLFIARRGDKGYSTRSILWPFTSLWKSESGHGGWLFPLFFLSHRPDVEKRLLVTPLFAHWKDGAETDAVFSPFLSKGIAEGGKFVNILGLLAHKSRRGDVSTGWALAGTLYGSSRPNGDHERWIAPVFWQSRSGPRSQLRFCLGLIFSQVRDRRTPDEILQQMKSNESAPKRIDRLRKFMLLGLIGQKDSFKVDFNPHEDTSENQKNVTRRRVWWLFPFIHSSNTNTGERHFNVLWRLYDEDREPLADASEEKVRKRVLWRFWHYEKAGDRVAIDAFPFLSFDKAPELRSWSFAGGLAGARTVNGRSGWRLLWIPFGDAWNTEDSGQR